MAADTWQELSGYDGRIARTFRLLLRRPGALTIEVLEGRRARYVSPLRLYLIASVVYFLITAVAPNVRGIDEPAAPDSTVKIDLRDPAAGVQSLSDEERKEALEAISRFPRWAAPTLRAVLLDPAAFRARFIENLPRTFFVLVPVFAAILALFFRRRPFSQHLVLALHLHAAMFVASAAAELVSFTQHAGLSVAADVGARLYGLGYGVIALRKVYRERWYWIVAKGVGVMTLYVLATIVALAATIAWVAWHDGTPPRGHQ